MTTAGHDFSINFEWDVAPGVRAAEHRATWARIEIKAGPDWVTLVEDRESGSSRRSIYCALYPLAEWAAYNWWFLQADSRPAALLSQDPREVNPASRQLPAPMREHHSIRASGDGFAWPDLLIVPDGEGTRLVWEADGPEASSLPIRFLTRGDIWVNSLVIRRELTSVITSVLTRLAEHGIVDTVLHNEWNAIQGTSKDEAEYCLAAARLGLDPYGAAEEFESAIMRAATELSAPLLHDFLDAVNPTEIASALDWIAVARRAIRRGESDHIAPGEGERIRLLQDVAIDDSGLTSLREWDIGYDQARAVRAQVVADDTAPFDVSRYVTKITRPGADRNLQALGESPGAGNTRVVIGTYRTASSTRFILSRALWHSIWDRSRPLFAVTSAHTSRQRVERAFAAELLAPSAGIAALLDAPAGAASSDDVERIARHYGVSSMVVDHQIRNRLMPAA